MNRPADQPAAPDDFDGQSIPADVMARVAAAAEADEPAPGLQASWDDEIDEAAQ